MVPPIAKIDDQPNNQPDEKPEPGVGRQAEHQQRRSSNAEHRQPRRSRCTERALRKLLRTVQMQHCAADQQKGEQGADTYHLAEQAYRQASSQEGNGDTDLCLAEKRRAEPWMKRAEERRQQTVLGNRIEDTRCPNSSTKMTVVNPASAANFTRMDSQQIPVTSTATATGTPNRWYGTMPVTSAISIYSIVHTTSEPRMPIGMCCCGRLASCAAVETASKPVYAKNTTDDPRKTPAPAEFAELAGIRRNERLPVRTLHVDRANHCDDGNDEQLERHHHIVDASRSPGAEHQQSGQHTDDEHRRQIDDPDNRAAIRKLDRLGGGLRPLCGAVYAKAAKQTYGVSGPADSEGCGARAVFEDEIPPMIQAKFSSIVAYLYV